MGDKKQQVAEITGVDSTKDRQLVSYDKTLLSNDDLFLFNQGSHFQLYNKLGAHLTTHNGVAGAYFSVWAPDAKQVSVMGDFNGWSKESYVLKPRDSSGIWEGFIPGVERGNIYKYYIVSRYHGYRVDKTDPFSVYNEIPPRTGSVVWDLDYEWHDQEWMHNRGAKNSSTSPMSIYEVHAGSWMRVAEEDHRYLTYRELAHRLADYVKRMGFTHVEFLPLTEHPFYGSWGYQVNAFFAPTSRYGSPQDLMYLVDYFHQEGIGVILDWVPSHFPKDEHGIGYFDGTHLYEHGDPREGVHADWDSLVFNYGRNEVQSFLISSALFWLEEYHMDGLRVDAVASMLYRDYARKEGEWIPNKYGGRENLEAVTFLRRLNEEVYRRVPDVHTIAEESTSWPMVSRPTYVGGLGFGMKWDMGWMHDTLQYMSKDPIHRCYHHDRLTFRMLYAYHENFVLPLSHDEVVHGKGSLIQKMPGDEWQKFANLRLLLGYMYGQPGKKLLFMGCEFGQWSEWYHEVSLDWHLLDYPFHAGMSQWMQDLNRLYRQEPALYECDFGSEGFRWIDCNDNQASTLSFIRNGRSADDVIIVACNFTPVPREAYHIGAPRRGKWKELLNSDATVYRGSGWGNMGEVTADEVPCHGLPYSLSINVPPLGIVFFKKEK